MNEDQLDRLEMKIAFQEDLLQKLDDAVFVQQQQILLLEDQVRVLSELFVFGVALRGALSRDRGPVPSHARSFFGAFRVSHISGHSSECRRKVVKLV